MSVSFDLSVLYRGPLASCNYACVYCPFAKSESSPSELAKDRAALERFVRWVEAQKTLKLGILITPWGEALIRDYYRDAIVDLSHFDSVRKIAIQTNLSCRLDWLEHAHRPSVGLWCTYHPSQTRRSDFVAQCRKLDALDVRYSVGVVGLKEHLDAIEALRAELPASVYLWVNAYKRDPSYYEVSELDFLGRIDPHFAINNQRHRSFGESCRAGEHAVSVDGAGNLRRCHFIEAPIGNIYEPRLGPSPSPPQLFRNHLRLPHRLHAPRPFEALRYLRRRDPGAHPENDTGQVTCAAKLCSMRLSTFRARSGSAPFLSIKTDA